jgi:NAD(P)-dependent dehydrogenase (short-subunit alcohol dehydrogenase family)
MLERMLNLNGKVALVTGGGSGLGRGIAAGFLEAGAARVYIASRKQDALEATAAELSSDGRCIPIVANLGTVEGCRALAQDLGSREPKLHIVVHNSGAAWAADFKDYPESGWDRVFQLNLKAPFFLTQALSELLAAAAAERDPARVINIGSIAGQIHNGSKTFAYGVSKSAIHHLTTMLALELAPQGVTVNAIAPGRIGTRMTSYVTQDAARFARESEMIPLGRWGDPEEIGALAVYMASPAAAYMTGEVIAMDGGLRLIHPFDQSPD